MRMSSKAWAPVASLPVFTVAQAVAVPGLGRWETALLPRDSDGDGLSGPQALHNTALEITWLRDVGVHRVVYRDAANIWGQQMGDRRHRRLPSGVNTAMRRAATLALWTATAAAT